MHLPAASRPTRVRRLLAVSAAAAFVMIGPTACDYGAYSGGSSDGYAAGGQAESSSGDNVVPVGNSSPSTEESGRDRWQNAYVSNGGGDDGDGDGDNEQPAATPTTAPAAEPTDPAAHARYGRVTGAGGSRSDRHRGADGVRLGDGDRGTGWR